MRFYGEKISKGEDTCNVQVIDMVDGTSEDWEKGQSQTEHGKFMISKGTSKELNHLRYVLLCYHLT